MWYSVCSVSMKFYVWIISLKNSQTLKFTKLKKSRSLITLSMNDTYLLVRHGVSTDRLGRGTDRWLGLFRWYIMKITVEYPLNSMYILNAVSKWYSGKDIPARTEMKAVKYPSLAVANLSRPIRKKLVRCRNIKPYFIKNDMEHERKRFRRGLL